MVTEELENPRYTEIDCASCTDCEFQGNCRIKAEKEKAKRQAVVSILDFANPHSGFLVIMVESDDRERN